MDLAIGAPDNPEIRLAQRAVIVHQLESWPHGDFCRNCHARFPCPPARWGHQALTYAGYTESVVAALVADVRRTGCLPGERR